MDLRFTNGFVTVNKKDDPKSFITAMKNPDATPSPTMHTDIRDKLSEIIQDHLRDAENQKRWNSKPKYLTLIIFTDGIWQGTPVKEQVRRKIIELVTRTMEVIGELKLRPVSIEFVQFGNDVDAMYRLKALDNNWDYDGIPDIVDTTRSDRDPDKMMLGSFVEAYDLESDDDEESKPKTSIPVSISCIGG
ncbi:hypothetical protein B0O99DRAFT_635265 [Bisporella sp. PMI_857]|nr:hypothetical protein B0O99DRAFT_635265 [Bisporella sp. PMI_857]